MSLATTGGGGLGGGGGAGGLMMAHDANAAGSSALAPPPPPTTASFAKGAASSASTASAPVVEVCDKTQRLNLAKAKSTAHLPLTAVDLHAAMPTVAYFPAKVGREKPQEQKVLQPVFLGKMKAKLAFKATEASHKALRNYLTASSEDNPPSYAAMKRECFAVTKDGADHDKEDKDTTVVYVDRPHLMLGIRRIQQLNPFLQSQYPIRHEDTNENDDDDVPASWWTNSTLDGSELVEDIHDYDLDRAVVKLRLHATSSDNTKKKKKKKKPLTILPEEATQLLLHQARSHVATATKFVQDRAEDGSSKGDAADGGEEWTHFPIAFALPSWALHDAAAEALYEAAASTGAAGTGAGSQWNLDDDAPPTLLYPRSVCAVFGSLVKPDPSSTSNANPFVKRLQLVQQMLWKQQQQRSSNRSGKDGFSATTLVLTMGVTLEGCEVAAIQLSYPRDSSEDDDDSVAKYCLYEEYQVLANVSRLVSNQEDKPYNLLESCLQELELILDTVAPDSDGPAVVLSYGSSAEQDALHQTLTKGLKDSSSSLASWLQKVPVLSASPEAVPTGCALLGGVALGRVGSRSGRGNKNNLPVRVQSVAAVATGVARYYTPEQRKKHQTKIFQQLQEGTGAVDKRIKVIFDFDRRLPAGPYSMEFKASECVVHKRRSCGAEEKDAETVYNQDHEEDEAFWKAVKDAESSRNIPHREKAALDFTVQIFQKYSRDGPWHPVGNPLAPLVKLDTQVHETAEGEIKDDEEEKKIACEQTTLELSLAVMGVLTTGWGPGERESVVQAVKTARGRLYEYYGWLAFAILFFGGFFCKSYWEDYVWKRDTSRLLEYYQVALPGSPQDGDHDTARWLAYKYRHNKDKLWNNLETKYGVPVPKEWPSSSFESALDESVPDFETVAMLLKEKKENEQEEEVDLDAKPEASESEEENNDNESEETKDKSEPDL